MALLNSIWLILNIVLILLILIRSPDEQSLEETLSQLKLFGSSKSGEKNLDNIIQLLIFFYFLIGFILTSKAF